MIALFEIPHGPNWRKKLDPSLREMLGIPKTRLREKFSYRGSIADWCGIAEQDFILNRRKTLKMLHEVIMELDPSECPDGHIGKGKCLPGSPSALRFMREGILNEAIPLPYMVGPNRKILKVGGND